MVFLHECRAPASHRADRTGGDFHGNLGSIPSPATAIDARCITVSDVVILGGEETMANKRPVQVARLGPLRRGGDGDRGLWRGQHHRGL